MGKNNIKKNALLGLTTTLLLFLGCGSDSTAIESNTTKNIEENSSNSVDESNRTTSTATTLSYSIVDTAQNSCYDSISGAKKSCDGTGYDADYSKNEPSYSLSTTGKVVTDNVTSLMWTQSSDIDGDGETTDAGDKLSYDKSVAYCSTLTLDGYSDWRLPDIKTLYSVILFSGQDPSAYQGTDTSGLVTFLDSSFTKAFGDQSSNERIIDGQFASSTKYVSTTMSGDATMFGVNFVDGRIKGYPLQRGGADKEFYVRCVRGEERYGQNSFVDNSDKTISDTATNLMWQKNDAESTGFENALSVCESSALADYTDWRLPNVKELQSILDYSRSPDTTNSSAINPIFNSTSFTNENNVLDWGYYWASTTHLGYDGSGFSATYLSFGRALGYMRNAILDVHGAGSQRSNAKEIENISDTVTKTSTSLKDGSLFYYKGPQGDILRVNNMVRCVRDAKTTSQSTTKKPNILLIIADDMGLDATPSYDIGTVKPVMPNLQKMIDNGVRFNNFWSNPTCTPTRSSILTGKYGFRIGVTKVGDEVPTTETSLQQYLTDNSTYSNAVIGKWHLSNNPLHPTNMGVNYYAGLLNGSPTAYDDWKFTSNGATTQSTEYITTKFSDLAIDWLGKQTDPWFLWLAYTAPHTPFHLPPLDLHTQDSLASDQESIDANPLPYYMAMLESMDTEMGRVLASLSAEELANTIVIFIGDNGSPNKVAQEYNIHRVKGTVYQGGINVPMIVSGKGVSRKNVEEDALINTTDLFATIANIAGVNVTNINDSKSFKSLFTGTSSDTRSYVYAEVGNKSGGSDYTIRNKTHKYIKFDDGNESLYNLKKNPFERPDLLNEKQLPLSDANSAIKDELTAKLEQIRGD